MRQSVSPPPPAANGKIILVSGPESATALPASVDNESPAHPAIKPRRSTCSSRSDDLAQIHQTTGSNGMASGFQASSRNEKKPGGREATGRVLQSTGYIIPRCAIRTGLK